MQAGFRPRSGSFLISQCTSERRPPCASASCYFVTATHFLNTPREGGGGVPQPSAKSQEASFLEAAATFFLSLADIRLGYPYTNC